MANGERLFFGGLEAAAINDKRFKMKFFQLTKLILEFPLPLQRSMNAFYWLNWLSPDISYFRILWKNNTLSTHTHQTSFKYVIYTKRLCSWHIIVLTSTELTDYT